MQKRKKKSEVKMLNEHSAYFCTYNFDLAGENTQVSKVIFCKT